MAGDAVQRRFSLATVVGLFVGKRSYDGAVRKVLAGGFAGAAFFIVIREWRTDREAERALRQQQHGELVAVMKEQHAEDVKERRLDRCVSANLNDTVRSAIWRERPRPREECK